MAKMAASSSPSRAMKATAIAMLVNDATELPPVRLYTRIPYQEAIVPVNPVYRTISTLNRLPT